MSELSEAEGIFGPASMTWRIDREMVLLAGGSCAFLLQGAHPVVAAAVVDHSTYATDPFGRLMRTLTTSYEVVFGSAAEADAATRRVNAMHRAVRGRMPDTGAPYSALDPEALLWVHAALVDTALRVYSRLVRPLTPEEEQAYHVEATHAAARLGVDGTDLPTIESLRAWIASMIESGRARVTPEARVIAETVLYPRRFPPRWVWDAAHLVSLSMLHPTLRAQYGIGWSAARERGVERIARATRAVVPFLPPVLRDVPQARTADRRVAEARRRAAQVATASGS